MTAPTFNVALAGNPNCGKSTIFNALTGAHQHVGNWPGKTVERKEGHIRVDDHDVMLIDLPGAYSLNAFSAEEVITRDYILQERPDAVVAVVDSANLERNLYMVVQLLEMQVPLIMALNMADIAASRHIRIDRERLAGRLGGIPVVTTIGAKGIGLDDLKAAIHTTMEDRAVPAVQVQFDTLLEREIDDLTALIVADATLCARYDPRWLAIKLLEADEQLTGMLAAEHPELLAAVDAASERIAEASGEDADTLIADRRYRFVSTLLKGVVERPHQVAALTRSDRADQFLTHPLWGALAFMLIMWVIFQVTANVSAPYVDWVDAVLNGPVSRWAGTLLAVVGLGDTWLQALVVDGVIPGVGGVLVFVPVLVFLYLAIALLEDTGYMARAAFVMDRFMQKLGLHGKSFLPMLVGFGCNVPAVYATRTLENDLDRRITGFLISFMSCGARLPIYILFGAAFFGTASGNLIFAMYLLGILVAALTSLLFTRIVYRDKPAPLFVIELPPYRMPIARNVYLPMWHRIRDFLRHAGTVIFMASIMVWLLTAIPTPGNGGRFSDVPLEDSLFSTLSRVIAPVFAPAGFDDWNASGALVTGFVAKEAIIGTMNQLYVGGAEAEEAASTTFGQDVRDIAVSFGEAAILTVQETVNIVPATVSIVPGVNIPPANFLGLADNGDESALQAALRNTFSPLAAVAFNVFVLLYVPCMATTAAIRHEFGTRWMFYQAGYALVVAWVAAVLVYQVGSLLGFT